MLSDDTRERQNKALSELYRAVCKAQSADLEYDRSPKAFADENQRMTAMGSAMTACKVFCDAMALRDSPGSIGNVISNVYGRSQNMSRADAVPNQETQDAMDLMRGRAKGERTFQPVGNIL
jgi:hypothetical protein